MIDIPEQDLNPLNAVVGFSDYLFFGETLKLNSQHPFNSFRAESIITKAEAGKLESVDIRRFYRQAIHKNRRDATIINTAVQAGKEIPWYCTSYRQKPQVDNPASLVYDCKLTAKVLRLVLLCPMNQNHRL